MRRFTHDVVGLVCLRTPACGKRVQGTIPGNMAGLDT
jgi:hypothetical protein